MSQSEDSEELPARVRIRSQSSPLRYQPCRLFLRSCCSGATQKLYIYKLCPQNHGAPLYNFLFCMPLVRFKLRGPCNKSSVQTATTFFLLQPRQSAFRNTPPRLTPCAQLRSFHTQILKMDVRDLSESAASGDDLKLTNRLNESRSPYVSARPSLLRINEIWRAQHLVRD